MSLEWVERLVAFGSSVFTVITLLLTIRKMRQEMYVARITPLIIVLVTGFAVGIYILLTGTAINWLLAGVLLAAGFVIGVMEGQMTRVYYRGPIIVTKRSVAYIVFWGLAYALTMALSQTGSVSLHVAGVLSMLFGLGLALGDNLNLLVRQSLLKPAAVAVPVVAIAPEPFRNVETQYANLRGRFQSHLMTREQFETALSGLMVQDALGRCWTISRDSGKWFVQDRNNWVESNPYAPPLTAVGPGAQREGGCGCAAAGCVMIIPFIAIAGLVFLVYLDQILALFNSLQ